MIFNLVAIKSVFFEMTVRKITDNMYLKISMGATLYTHQYEIN